MEPSQIPDFTSYKWKVESENQFLFCASQDNDDKTKLGFQKSFPSDQSSFESILTTTFTSPLKVFNAQKAEILSPKVRKAKSTTKKKRRPAWDMKGRLEDLISIRSSLVEELEELNEKKEILDNWNTQRTLELSQYSLLLQKNAEIIPKLEHNLCEITTQLEKTKAVKSDAIHDLSSKNEILTKENTTLNNKASELEDELAKLGSNFSETHKELVTKKKLLSALQSETTTKENSVKELEERNIILNELHEKFLKEINCLQQEIKTMENKYKL